MKRRLAFALVGLVISFASPTLAQDPALKTYKQPATLRFEVFTCGAILGRSGHDLVLHMSKNWGGYSSRKPFFNSLLHWPPPTSPKFDPPTENAA